MRTVQQMKPAGPPRYAASRHPRSDKGKSDRVMRHPARWTQGDYPPVPPAAPLGTLPHHLQRTYPPSDQARSGRPNNRRILRRSDRIRTKFIPKEKRCTHPLSAPAFPAALAPPYGGTRTTGNACASTQSVPRLSLGINSSLRIRSITS